MGRTLGVRLTVMALMGPCGMWITRTLVDRMKLQCLEVVNVPSEEYFTDAVKVLADQQILSLWWTNGIREKRER